MSDVVAIVTDRWEAAGGGRERYLVQLATALTNRGSQVLVFCRRHSAGDGTEEAAFEVRVFPGPSAIAERRLHAALEQFSRERPGAVILAARPQPEATHYQLHSGLLSDSFAAERASMTSPLRRALYWPALAFNRRRARFLRAEDQVLGPTSPTRLMAFSEATARSLGDRYQVAADRVVVCPPGVDRTIFSAAPSPAGLEARLPRPYALFVGHNFRLKGLAPALEALARLQRDGDAVGLAVAGLGPARSWLRLASTLGVQRAPVFLGDIDQQTLAALYRGAVALVHPAFYDPYPRVVPEALSCGCPVVTTRQCGASELIEEGRNGSVVERPDDIEGLAAAMRAFLGEEAREAARPAAVLSATGLGLPEHFEAVSKWLGLGGSEEPPSGRASPRAASSRGSEETAGASPPGDRWRAGR